MYRNHSQHKGERLLHIRAYTLGDGILVSTLAKEGVRSMDKSDRLNAVSCIEPILLDL